MAKRKTKKEIALEVFSAIAPEYIDEPGDFDEDMEYLRWSFDNEEWAWSLESRRYFNRKWKQYLQAPRN
jgi:hypothetical protein